MRTRAWVAVCAGAMGVVGAWPSPAEACGGFFCDSGPQSMPVDQTGENILFVTTPDPGGGPPVVEAHIQIQYTGQAAKFAWVIPVQGVPEFDVGSQPLFDALLASSVPTYGQTVNFTCAPSGGGSSSGAAGGASSGGGSSSGGVTVVATERVGTFDVTVLQGTSATEMWDWLGQNGYQQPQSALPILEDYISTGHLFAAFKLAGGASVEELHPVVMRSTGGQPCVPLKLTAVASVPDMGVRVFFLDQTRVVPLTYAHVEFNPVKLNWSTLGSNYRSLISAAVDDPAANGRAFVTEYAGPSSVVTSSASAPFYTTAWEVGALSVATPQEAVAILLTRGLLVRTGSGNNPPVAATHGLLPAILRRYLPPPTGIDENTFWGCITCYSGQWDDTAFDASALDAEVTERIVAPGRHAQALLATRPYLTRMFTSISPQEMLEDPEFMAWQGLPDVSATRSSSVDRTCQGPDRVTLPGGWVVLVNGAWPDFTDMPAAEKVELYTREGAVQTLAVRTQTISQQLDAWNAQVNAGTNNGSGSTSGTSSGNGATSTIGGTSSNGGTSTGGGPSSTSDGPPPGPGDNNSTCVCSTPSAAGVPVLAIGLTWLALARWRRRST